MFFEICGVSLMLVKIFHKAFLTSPHIYIVLRISKMGCKTRSEVPCTKDDDFGVLSWLHFRVDHG